MEKYLESYGLKSRSTDDVEKLREQAKRNADYFQYGTLRQEASILSRLYSGSQWLLDQLKIGALSGRKEGQKAADATKEKASKEWERVTEEL